MRYLTDLADICRTSGLPVEEVYGWRTRGHGPMVDVRTIVNHHTAGAPSGDYPSMLTVRDGRPGLDGPLAQLGLGRSGTVYVIAAGLAWHAGVVLRDDYSNSHAIGIEAESTGYGSWTDAQRDAFPKLNAALCRGYRLAPADVLAHREVCAPPGRKPDPTGIDMPGLRKAVADLLNNSQEEDDMPYSRDEIKTMMREVLNEATGRGQTTGAGTIAATLGQGQTNYNKIGESVAAAAAARAAAEETRAEVAALRETVTAALSGVPSGASVQEIADAVVASMGTALQQD